jgi:hypothetical protein
MNAFQKQTLDYLGRFVEQNVLADSGQHAKHLIRTEPIICAAQVPSVALALAVVAEPEWGGHPEADRIRSLAAKLTDLWAERLSELVDSDGVIFSFPIVCYGPAVRLLEPHVTAARRRRWRRAMTNAAAGAARFLRAKQAAWGKPGPWTGCGPNHLFLTAASLFRFGQLLDDGALRRLARRAARKLCQLQSPEGYFPESIGPAVGYHQVSLYGLCDYYAASGDDTVLPCIKNGIRFVVRACYPDVTAIKTLDQRQRSGRRLGHVGGGGGSYSLSFGLTAPGRRYAQKMLDRTTRRVPETPRWSAYYAAGLAAMAALHHPGGRPARRLPCERPAYTDRFDGVAGIVRRDGWCLVLAGYHDSRRPGNPYILDRTQNVAVFHDRCGVIIGDSNDKNHFDAATFELLESGTCFYFPSIDEKARIRPGEGVLDLNFGAAHARLSAKIVSPRRVDLLAGAQTNFGDQRNRLNLQIPLGPGAEFRIDGREVRLRRRKTQKAWAVKKTVEFPGLARIDVPCASQFCWPHRPWNPYNAPTYESGIDAAVAYLRIPLSGDDLSERTVRIRALA